MGKIVNNIYIKSEKYTTYLEIHHKNIESCDTPIIFIKGLRENLNSFLPISDTYIYEPFIYYDQINSGKSLSEYKDTELKLNHFVEQLEIIVKYLKIKRFHIIGDSFGCIIANEFYLNNKYNVETIIFYRPYEYMDILLTDSKFSTIKTNKNILLISEKNYISNKNILELSKKITNIKLEILDNTRYISHSEKNLKLKQILLYFFKNYYQKKFYKKHIYYEKMILNNNDIDEKILSNKLLYIYITFPINSKYLEKILIDIKKINQFKKGIDVQSILDFWYCTKILGYKNRFKPNKLFLDYVYELMKNKSDNPSDSLLIYIYYRTLSYCDNKSLSITKINILKNNIKKNTIIYGYYLTHIILYDLKFGYIKIENLSKKKNVERAINELIILCNDERMLLPHNADLLCEIMICFKLCNIKNDIFDLQIYNILNRVKITDFHLNTVFAILSF